MTRKADLMRDYPKGSPRPPTYIAFHEWAEAQLLHGLKEEQCPCCKRWYFENEGHTHSAGESR